ncbi:unnamed protein product [Paramecium octaurelia]|uniref:RING-type domain-containing protein n=1 Tax=Paramecium octaurelia TaxID=43137 RepID=A0A8S1SNF6_PAROT|nr:unnamed protein product [Paramecium octaurelia]
MISIIYTLIQTSVGDILYQNSFNSMAGIQSFPLNQYCSSLSQEYKLRVMLTQQSNNHSLLAICQTNLNDIEKFQTLFQQDNHHDSNCLVDYNAYILENQTQQIVLSQQKMPTLVSQYHNIFSIEDNSCFAIIYSNFNSILILTIERIGIDDCVVNCKNQGICTKGLCQCPLGYLGFDCNIVSSNIHLNSYFHGLQIFYLDLITLQTNDYKLILNQELQYTITCYANSPHLLSTQNQSSVIYISEESIIKCKEVTETLRVFTQLKYYSQFVIITNTTTVVKLAELEEQYYSIILVASVMAFILGLIVIFITLTYLLKIYKEKQIIKNKQRFENLMPAQQFMSVSDRFPESKSETTCSICLEPFTSSSLVRMTYCEHVFHSRCLERWMKNNKICPLCRASLDTQTIKSKKKIEPSPFKAKNGQGSILQQLSLFPKNDGSLHSIDGSLSYHSPVIRSSLQIIQPKKFELK